MVNKYFEKIARWSNVEIGITAGGALAGGLAFGLPKEDEYYDWKKGKTVKKELTTKQRVGRGLLGATLVGGAFAGNIHADRTIRQATGEAFRGARGKGFRQRFYEEQARQHNENLARKMMGNVDEHLKHFGVKKNSFKTKAEAAHHFKTQLHKNHPDKHGGSQEATNRFQHMSRARDNILKSDWFEKLAKLQNKYINALL